jgi:hypothetical protein
MPDWQTVITFLGAVLLALLGYFVTYLNNLRLAQRQARLDRVNKQLKEFYGPLFALTRASTMSWAAFRRVYRPGGSFWDEGHAPTDEEAARWRTWMTEVFMPRNLEMVRIITEHSDLLDEDEMPDCLLTLCAHVAGYMPVLKAWEEGDFSRHTSVVNFPAEELLAYTQANYDRLKREQARLLGKRVSNHLPAPASDLDHPMAREHLSGVTAQLGRLALEYAGDSTARRLEASLATDEAMRDLFEKCATPDGRAEIAEETGISPRALLEWARRVDLLRVVQDEEMAGLLEAAGIDSIRELGARNPANLHTRLLEVNEQRQLVREAPPLAEIEGWIRQAKRTVSMITYQ